MNLRSVFHLLGSLSIYIVSLVIGLAVTYVVIRHVLFAPADPSSKEEFGFLIERGTNLKQVAERLEAQHLVKSTLSIELLSRLKFDDRRNKIIAGEYKLSPSYTPLRILEIIMGGDVVYNQLTILPGSRVSDVAKLIADTTLVTLDEVQKALVDPRLIRDLNVQGGSFEGYLFPETYKFSKPIDSKEIITRIVAEGRKRFTNEMLERTVALGFNVHQVLTLASIIEKETGNDADRKMISSVLHNRLRLGMFLQSDPTVIYGLPKFDGNLTREHLKTPSVYNTYMITGLPPTPICNPGINSINAALYPSESDFLYFVGRGDGTSQFSANLKDHNEAVKKYQLGKAPLLEQSTSSVPGLITGKKGKDDVIELDELEKLQEKKPEKVTPPSGKKGLTQLDPLKERSRNEDGQMRGFPQGSVRPGRPTRYPTKEQLDQILKQ